jgi:hypothetical protein
VKEGAGSAHFSGSNYFQITNDGTFSPAEFTITCWCKIVQNSGYSAIASSRAASPLRGWMIYVFNNNLEFWTGANDYFDVYSLYTSFAAYTPTWMHLAITMKQSTKEMKAYVNNQLVGTYSPTYFVNPTTNLRIGAGANELAANYYLPSGSRLDDFRIYNRILTGTEIKMTFSNSLDCRQCSAGTYSIAAGTASALECSPCTTGKISAAGASACSWVRSIHFLRKMNCAKINSNEYMHVLHMYVALCIYTHIYVYIHLSHMQLAYA